MQEKNDCYKLMAKKKHCEGGYGMPPHSEKPGRRFLGPRISSGHWRAFWYVGRPRAFPTDLGIRGILKLGNVGYGAFCTVSRDKTTASTKYEMIRVWKKAEKTCRFLQKCSQHFEMNHFVGCTYNIRARNARLEHDVGVAKLRQYQPIRGAKGYTVKEY